MRYGFVFPFFCLLVVLEFCPIEEYNWDFGWMWVAITILGVINSPVFVKLIDLAIEQTKEEANKNKEDKTGKMKPGSSAA